MTGLNLYMMAGLALVLCCLAPLGIAGDSVHAGNTTPAPGAKNMVDIHATEARLRGHLKKNPDLPVIKLTVPFNGWILPAVRLSDHASFWDAGFQAVMITDSAFYRNPHYHLPSDRPEILDYRFMAELVESLAAFVAEQP
jgi:hypothetical protein